MTAAARKIAPGDFSTLSDDYSRYRPEYAPQLLALLAGLLKRPVSECSLADVGAGTGIWTRMLNSLSPAQITAVEPNDAMRAQGEKDSSSTPIAWCKGTGEVTGLADGSCDFLSMASSFHWADTEKALAEFHRVLKPGGVFMALWNPRYLEKTPKLNAIETELKAKYGVEKRVSSGRSGIADRMMDILLATPHFTQPLYLEGFHSVQMPVASYMGAWRSVNDVRSQMGEEKFEQFLQELETALKGTDTLEIWYQTRAWAAWRA